MEGAVMAAAPRRGRCIVVALVLLAGFVVVLFRLFNLQILQAAELTVKAPAGPVKPWPMPSKLLAGAGIKSGTALACTTGSCAPWLKRRGTGLTGCSLSSSEGGAGRMRLSGAETS